jgi:hypothetical protein
MYLTIGPWRFGAETMLSDNQGNIASTPVEIIKARSQRLVLFLFNREFPVGSIRAWEESADDE